MKKIYILLFSFLSFLFANSQHANSYTKFLIKTDTAEINNTDIQVRLWFNNGANRINTAYYMVLTRKNNLWDARNYTFTSFPGQNDSIIVKQGEVYKMKYDSLYSELVNDGLLTINNIDNARYEKWGVVWTDAGPTNYTIELITGNERREINFKCPKYFLTEYKIEELKIPLKIISSLLGIIGKQPC